MVIKMKLTPEKDGILLGRRLEFFHHNTMPEWGYAADQTDTYALLHPKNEIEGVRYPLYVVFHSAGHDVYSTIGCTWAEGNHDIYHAPEDMYALYLDCRANEKNDWWWGGINAHGEGDPSRSGTELQPVEKRCIATIEHIIETCPIDTERVYAVGNSMGGSGALGIAMRRGDIFAAVKVNVPAGVRHFADRCCLDTVAPDGFRIPDPPVLVDYSAQNDGWSDGHEVLYRGMREKRYALLGYWGNFGHANNNSVMEKENDLIHSFDIFSVRKSAPYPVFTNATTDDKNPWENDRSVTTSGQVNSFFRWENGIDGERELSMTLRLLREDEWKSRVTFPDSSTADVTIRRAYNFRPNPGETINWKYGTAHGTVTADSEGLVTIERLTITKTPETLTLTRA